MPIVKGWLQQLSLSAEQLQALAQDEDPSYKLIEKNWCSAEEILRVESLYYQCPSLSLRRYQPDLNVVRLLTEQQARRVRAIPLFRVNDHLYLATSDPENLQAQDFVAQLTGLVVEPVVSRTVPVTEPVIGAWSSSAADAAAGVVPAVTLTGWIPTPS